MPSRLHHIPLDVCVVLPKCGGDGIHDRLGNKPNTITMVVLPFPSTKALMNLKNMKLPMVKPPPFTSQILQDGVFEGLPPDAQFVRSEAR